MNYKLGKVGNNMEKYYIVRTDRAGVFAGNIKERNGDEVTMTNVRKLWYWDGACAVEQISVDGTNKADNCKFTITVNEMTLLGAIQIIECTEKAEKVIKVVS